MIDPRRLIELGMAPPLAIEIATGVNGVVPDLTGFAIHGDVLSVSDRVGEIEGQLPPAWGDISGKPSVFPPDTHGHTIADVDGLQNSLDGKAMSEHGHTIGDVSDLQTELNGKSAVVHGHDWGDLSDVPLTFPPASHGHIISDVTDLPEELGNKSNIDHAHDWDEIGDKPATFPADAHGHDWEDISNVPAPHRIEVYSGTTNGSGLFNVTFSPAYDVAPIVIPEAPTVAGRSWIKESVTDSGFSLRLVNRATLSVLSLEVLAGAVTNVSGASVRALVVAS